jgi:acetyl-CoA acetyltransferase
MSYKTEIPYGAYWSTPFARWQGAFANLHSLEFAAHTVHKELARRKIPAEAIEHGVLGFSVPQSHSFYGLPWVAGRAGLGHIAGPTIMQACATGVRALLAAVQEAEAGMCRASLALTCDRTSNGPHLYYPNPKGPGGTGAHEDWVMDNFGCDPLGRHSMLQTAENVAAKHQITTEQQHEVVLLREKQYRDALADGCAFQKRYMNLPFEVPDPAFKKTTGKLESDEGIRFSTSEGLANLAPVLPDGTVTYGGQTHPADGNAAIVVADAGRAGELSRDRNIRVKLHGFGSRYDDRQDGRHQDPQPIRRKRCPILTPDRCSAGKDEQFRLFSGLGTSTSPHGYARGDRTHRRAGTARWRLWIVCRVRCWRYRNGCRRRSRRSPQLSMGVSNG